MMVATDFFGPLPQAELDLDQIKRWVQYNTDTFHRSISMQGTLFSADFVSETSGWRLLPDGTAEFNEDVNIGGANTTNAQLFIHNTLQHINLLENDGANYPEDLFIIDANGESGRLFWADLDGANPTIFYGGLNINGPNHANAHDIRFRNSTPADVLQWDNSAAAWIFLPDGTNESLRIDDGGATDHKDVGIVKARTNTEAATAISTSEVVEQSVTIAIPASWNTYDLECLSVADILESGTLTAVRSVTTRIRFTDATGTIISTAISQIGQNAPNRFQQVTFDYREGETATGNVVIVWTAQLGGDSGQASWDNGTLVVTAYRTS